MKNTDKKVFFYFCIKRYIKKVNITLKKINKYGIIKMVFLYTDFQNYIILQKGEMHYGN